MNEFNELINKLHKAGTYLAQTDYIVIKLSEALANGDDIIELKTTYAEQLAKRKEYRMTIDQLQAEIDALDKELKASEEAKNDEDVIEQPVEEIPTDTSEVVEDTTTEKVVEQPIEETPSEQPIKETPTEVVENLE